VLTSFQNDNPQLQTDLEKYFFNVAHAKRSIRNCKEDIYRKIKKDNKIFPEMIKEINKIFLKKA